MTARDDEVRDWIARFIEQRHYAPSVREIAIGLGMRSNATALYHMVRLRDRGDITYVPGQARTIVVRAMWPEMLNEGDG